MSRFGVMDYYCIIHNYFCSHIVYLKYLFYIYIVKQKQRQNESNKTIQHRISKAPFSKIGNDDVRGTRNLHQLQRSIGNNRKQIIPPTTTTAPH